MAGQWSGHGHPSITQAKPNKTWPAAQCSLKHGRTQALFCKRFLSENMSQHNNLCSNVFCSKFLFFHGWWVKPGHVIDQLVLQNVDPKRMARPLRKLRYVQSFTLYEAQFCSMKTCSLALTVCTAVRRLLRYN